MAVKYCTYCDQHPDEKGRVGSSGLMAGINCPVCYEPTCRHHLATVRWRWRRDGKVDAARVCKACQRSYKHRDWDKLNRDWIT